MAFDITKGKTRWITCHDVRGDSLRKGRRLTGTDEVIVDPDTSRKAYSGTRCECGYVESQLATVTVNVGAQAEDRQARKRGTA